MDSSDDDFDMGEKKGKEKAPAPKPPRKKNMAPVLSDLDDLVEESKRAIVTSEKISAIGNMGDDIFEDDLVETAKRKARTAATEARDKRENKAIINDKSVEVPGAIQVFRLSQKQTPPDLQFTLTQPTGGLSALFKAVENAESDPGDLEDLLRTVLVPWVKQKLNGKAPPELCRWLLGLVSQHEEVVVVMAAEEALLQLLAEDGKVWMLRYQDTIDIWRGCGAVWLATAGGGDAMVVEGGRDGIEDEDDDDHGEDDQEEESDCHLEHNLRPALNVVEACFRRSAYAMNPAELREMLLDLLAASLDKRVSGSCQIEVRRAVVAVIDAMPAEQFEDETAFSALVDLMCDPSARALNSQMTPLSWVLLARSIPFRRFSSPPSSSLSSASGCGMAAEDTTDGAPSKDGIVAMAVPSLRHEVCHRLLERFLSDTPYVDAERSSKGLGRALAALEVLLIDETEDLLEESETAYERQYVVIALASEMAADSIVLSRSRKPSAEESQEMVRLLNGINKKMKSVMQETVQMSKTLLDLMKSKYTPFLSNPKGRQSKLPFASASNGGDVREITTEDGDAGFDDEDNDDD